MSEGSVGGEVPDIEVAGGGSSHRSGERERGVGDVTLHQDDDNDD